MKFTSSLLKNGWRDITSSLPKNGWWDIGGCALPQTPSVCSVKFSSYFAAVDTCLSKENILLQIIRNTSHTDLCPYNEQSTVFSIRKIREWTRMSELRTMSMHVNSHLDTQSDNHTNSRTHESLTEYPWNLNIISTQKSLNFYERRKTYCIIQRFCMKHSYTGIYNTYLIQSEMVYHRYRHIINSQHLPPLRNYYNVFAGFTNGR